MASTAHSKILRVGVIQGGKIVDERHLRRRDDVTVGQDARNTFVIPASNLPPSFPVLEHKANQYSLVFTEDMQGRVNLGSSDVDFQTLRAKGMASKRGNLYILPLPESAKGKVSLGDVTLLFQFVTPPPAPAKPELPEGVRGGVWRSLDRLFFGILAVSLIVNFSGATLIALSEKPVEQEVALDDLPDRFAKLLTPAPPPKKEEPKPEAAIKDPVEEKKKPEKTDKPSADPVQRHEQIAKKVSGAGLLKVLGSSGSSGKGAFDDIIGNSTGGADIANALNGATGVGVANAGNIGNSGPKGGSTGSVAGIGDLATKGGGQVDLGNKREVAVAGRVKDSTPEVDSADVDRNALARYVKARLKAIQNCYERELKRNPSLKGKVVVRFSIMTSGRTGDIDIEENTLGDEAVASCIRTVIRSWIFPFKPDDSVPVAYPFVFSPAG